MPHNKSIIMYMPLYFIFLTCPRYGHNIPPYVGLPHSMQISLYNVLSKYTNLFFLIFFVREGLME
jgi:hypothetical protein